MLRKMSGSRVVTATFALALALIAAFPGGAQDIDHARIEALFAILLSDDGQAEAVPTGSGSAPPMLPPLEPPPDDLTTVGQSSGRGHSDSESLFPADQPTGQGCPSSITDFSDAVDRVEATALNYGQQLGSLEEQFVRISDAMMEWRVSGELTCQDRLVSGIDDLVARLAVFDVGDNLLPVENLGTCAQRTATRLNADINAIAPEAPVEEQRRAEALNRQLGIVGEMDVRLDESLKQLASARQKQIRLVTATGGFRDECDAAQNLSFGAYE